MASQLPINLNDLLNLIGIETDRIEFKSTWDENIKKSTMRTVCAFANDFLNLNGGYVLIGIEEDENSRAVLPPRGLNEFDIDLIQREIIGACKRSLTPEYMPLVSLEVFDEREILVIWAPGGDNRPYQAPKRNENGRAYFIRIGTTTIEAEGDLLRQLLENTAKIPFDDRRCSNGKLEDISSSLVQDFLNDIRSQLRSGDLADVQIYRQLHLLFKMNGHEIPRNIALLFFNDDPRIFFSSAYIEVVQFGAEGDLIEERKFIGPLPRQIKSCLEYLNELGGAIIEKKTGQAEVEKTVPYPYEALEEAIANAVYHRGYEDIYEPIKIYLYPDRLEIISYPGPVPGLKIEHFEKEQSVPPVPARNRRIGELLKEFRLAERRGTGVPKIKRNMAENGSPDPNFDFDENLSYFRVTLPVHPRYKILNIIRESTHLWITGEKEKAISKLKHSFEKNPNSGIIAGQLIEYAFGYDDERFAKNIIKTFESQKGKVDVSIPYLAMARLLIERQSPSEAKEYLDKIEHLPSFKEGFEAAILKKRLKDFQGAHRILKELYSVNHDDPRIIDELAQTKLKLAKTLWRRGDYQTKKKLNKEAVELFRKAIQLNQNEFRLSWCWFNLANALAWPEGKNSEVEEAFLRAISLNPDEEIFSQGYNRWKDRVKPKGKK